jgi:hypothetical protein
MVPAEIKLRSIIHEIVMNERGQSPQGDAGWGRNVGNESTNAQHEAGPYITASIISKDPKARKKIVDQIVKAKRNVATSFDSRIAVNSTVAGVIRNIENNIDKDFVLVDKSTVEQGKIETINIESLEQLIELGVLSSEDIELLNGRFLIEARESLLDGCLKDIKPDPTTKDYIKRVIANGTAEFSFGFVDNAVLIFAGNAIDKKLDGKLLKTIKLPGPGKYYQIVMVGFVAAGVGNAISDGFGAAVAGPVLDAVGFSPENYVTDEQMADAHLFWRTLDSLAGIVGVVIGCLVGLVPAFFLDSYKVALAAAGYIWAAKSLAASTQIELPFAAAAAEAAAGVTAAGVLTFTAVITVVATGLFGLYSWSMLASAQSKNNIKGLGSHQRRILMGLGIKVGVNVDKSEKQWQHQITNKDIFLFKHAITERKEEVQRLWHMHMHPTQIASDTDSYDVDALEEAVIELSDLYKLDFPTNSRIINEARWQKLAGII